jgi:hypothetical protein
MGADQFGMTVQAVAAMFAPPRLACPIDRPSGQAASGDIGHRFEFP